MFLDLDRMNRSEWIAVAGGLLLAVATFLPWYGTSDNPNAVIDGERGDFSAWEVHPIIRWLMLGTAAAPLILAWIVLRDHQLSWPRGDATAVAAGSRGTRARCRRSRAPSARGARACRGS